AARPMLCTSRPSAPDRIPLTGARYRPANQKQSTVVTTPTAIVPTPVLTDSIGRYVPALPMRQPADQPTSRAATSTASRRRPGGGRCPGGGQAALSGAGAPAVAARGASCEPSAAARMATGAGGRRSPACRPPPRSYTDGPTPHRLLTWPPCDGR